MGQSFGCDSWSLTWFRLRSTGQVEVSLVALVGVINLSYDLQEYRFLAFGTVYFRSAASEI